MSTSVMVNNISPLLEKEHITQLFECCGPITNLIWEKNGNQRICIITFQEASQAHGATLLTGTPLGDRQLDVQAHHGSVRQAPPASAPFNPSAPSMPMPGMSVVSPMSNSITIPPVAPGGMPEVTINLPGGVTMPQYDQNVMVKASMEHEELIARTIYVGNLSLAVTEEHVKHFFSSCGTILFVKMAGRQPPARFAFVEFASKQAAATALSLTGSILLDCSLKVGRATNPIIKPKTKTDQPKLDEIMARVRAAQQKVSSKVRSNRSRSRSRSGSRDRSRRKSRSRSRDRGRRRRSRSRDRDRRGGGRDRDRRGRSRSPPKPRGRAKKPDPHAGMFFDGYTWQPIQAPGAGPAENLPPMHVSR